MTSGERTTRVLVVHPDPREAVKVVDSVLAAPGGSMVCEHASSAGQARELVLAGNFDVLVVEATGELEDPGRLLEVLGPAAASCALVARCSTPTEDLTVCCLENGFDECVGHEDDGSRLATTILRAVARRRAIKGNDLMAAIISASSDTIFSVDRSGRFTSFNSGAERLFGYSAQEAIGQHVSLIAAGDQTDEQVRWYHQLLAGESVFDQWTTRTRADGSLVEVSVTSSPIFTSDGAVTGICTVMRDVSGMVGGRGHLKRQNQLLTAAQSASKVGSWEYDIASGQLSWSEEMYRLCGLDPSQQQVNYAEMLELIHPEDRDDMVAATTQWMSAPGASVNHEYRVVTPEGEARTLLVRGLHVHAKDGGPGRLVGTAIDVSDERAQQDAVLRAQRQFKQSFDDAPAPMWIARLDGTLSEVNDALCELLARDRAQLLGASMTEFLHPDDAGDSGLTDELLDAGDRASVTGERRFLHADGHVIWAIVGMTLIRDADGSPAHLIGHAQDITSRRRYEERLRHMADHDPLTGLLNRRGFDRELRRHVSHISRYGASGALLIIDLDRFKQFNDAYGHTAGDNLIAGLSRGLHGRLRANDVIGRLGGDEFAVLLPEADREQAEAVAVALLEYVRDEPQAAAFEAGRQLTTSIGIFSFEGEGPFSKDRAMIAADLAMYEAKGLGRNRYAHYDTRRAAERDLPDAANRPAVEPD